MDKRGLVGSFEVKGRKTVLIETVGNMEANGARRTAQARREQGQSVRWAHAYLAPAV
jgi:hypothetical protein